jgi:hypothetical protein
LRSSVPPRPPSSCPASLKSRIYEQTQVASGSRRLSIGALFAARPGSKSFIGAPHTQNRSGRFRIFAPQNSLGSLALLPPCFPVNFALWVLDPSIRMSNLQKSRGFPRFFVVSNFGAGEGIRTPDPNLGKGRRKG